MSMSKIDPVTYLFVPADRPDRFAKALSAGADRVILDLEDAVRPDAKETARDAIRKADLDWQRIVIRVNPATGSAFAADLELLAAVPVAAVLLPKAERVEDIAAARSASTREVEILPQVETAIGLDCLDALLTAPGVERVAFGHLDYALDIGSKPEPEALSFARQHLVWRSRVADRSAPVDSVTPDLSEDAISSDARNASALGFGGKLLIHPKQVEPCRSAFAPSPDELEWARRVVAAVDRGGAGAVSLDGRMIDKPVEDAARRILSRAANSQGGEHAPSGREQ